MKLISWNVNGIRAVAKKWFLEFFDTEKPDVLGIQETKAFSHQIGPELLHPGGYFTTRHAGERPGYAGTALFCKEQPDQQQVVFDGFQKFHEDGRITEVHYQGYTILNIYFPNGGTRANGQEMLTYKLKFYDELAQYLIPKKEAGEKIILMGDFNICHTEIDIARPEANKDSIGFKPIERKRIGDFMQEVGLVDVFRHFHPEKVDEYTWWSYRGGARFRNVGRRIDYMMVCESLIDKVTSFRHRQDIMGSDHCPVEMVIE